MKKIITLTGIIIGIVIIASGWIIYSNNIPNVPEEEIENGQEVSKKKVFLVIDDEEELLQTFEFEFNEGLTAFDLLKNKTEELDMILKTEVYDFGILITAIGDKENGEDGKYWLYYVNGEMPMISADKNEIKAGDKIEFKFEKSPF